MRTPVNGAELRLASTSGGVRGTSLGAADGAADEEAVRDSKTTLAAHCSLDGDEPDDVHGDREEKFELESVLIAQW